MENDFTKYSKEELVGKNMNLSMKVGENICYLDEYNWERAVITKVGRTKYEILVTPGGFFGTQHIKKVSPEKIASLEELVCVVWETWKGRNGRGAYRVERVLYPDRRVPAKKVSRQDADGIDSGRVTEIEYGKLD